MDDLQKRDLWWRIAENHFDKPEGNDTLTVAGRSAFNKMRDFLGVHREVHFTDIWTPELEQKLLMLDGPYGSTLLKAMEVVREHDDGQKCG